MHERVHEAPSETIGGVRVARGLRLCSSKLGLYGVADVVEFRPTDCRDERTVVLPGAEQRWFVYPVEYKRGRRKPEMSYFVQLCAQALCLEEMLGGLIPAGALYHGQSRHRQEVAFDDALRTRTWNRIQELHRLVDSRETPPPVFGPKCKFCSLAEKCMPKVSPSQSADRYVTKTIAAILRDSDDDTPRDGSIDEET
jgi:CRISPR-associated exonuclease Cas4